MAAPRQLLFCLPSAGAGASAYAGWTSALAPDVGVRPVALPGREQRFDEPPSRDCTSLIARIAPGVGAQLDRPYAIFGHSMGALVGFELACALRAMGYPEPACLMVSGYPPPQVPLARPPVHEASDDRILDVVRSFGGVPEDVLATRDYLDFMLPLMRADLAVLETYRFTARPPLRCPIIAIGGQTDYVCRADQLQGWREHAAGDFTVRVFPGGHFHLFEQREPILAFIREALAASRAA